MTDTYDKAMQAIKEVEQLEAESAAEPTITFSMTASVAIQVFATLHIAIKVREEWMSGDLKRNQLPSPCARIELEQLRGAAEIMKKAIGASTKSEREPVSEPDGLR